MIADNEPWFQYVGVPKAREDVKAIIDNVFQFSQILEYDILASLPDREQQLQALMVLSVEMAEENIAVNAFADSFLDFANSQLQEVEKLNTVRDDIESLEHNWVKGEALWTRTLEDLKTTRLSVWMSSRSHRENTRSPSGGGCSGGDGRGGCPLLVVGRPRVTTAGIPDVTPYVIPIVTTPRRPQLKIVQINIQLRS